MARTNKSAMAKTIPAPVAASTLANLEQHTTTQAIRAARPAGVKTGASVNFSGQYLYDRFVANDKEEVTKMDLVRMMASQMDTASFKKVVADFVGVAKGYADNALIEAKKNPTFNADNPPASVVTANARLKTAKNHQTVMRIAYGAIKFALPKLEELGYDLTTGYQVMRVIGLQALEKAGLNWDGSKAESKEVKDGRKANKEEAAALASVMDNTPKLEGESRADYFARIDKAVENQLKVQRAEQHAEMVKKLADKVRKEAGSMLPELLDLLAQAEQQA